MNGIKVCCVLLAVIFRSVSVGIFGVGCFFALRSHTFLVLCNTFECKVRVYNVHNAVVISTIAVIFAFIAWVFILVEIIAVSTMALRCCIVAPGCDTCRDLSEQSTIWLHVCTGFFAFVAGCLEVAAYHIVIKGYKETVGKDLLIAAILMCTSLILFTIAGITTYCAGCTQGPESSGEVQQDPEIISTPRPRKDDAETSPEPLVHFSQDSQTPNTQEVPDKNHYQRTSWSEALADGFPPPHLFMKD